MNKKLLIGIAILLLTISISALPYLLLHAEQTKATDYKEITHSLETSSPYQSKLEAYRARRQSRAPERVASVFGDQEPQQTPQPQIEKPASEVYTPPPKFTSKHTDVTPLDAEFDSEFRQIEKQVRGVYNQEKTETTTETTGTLEEKRAQILAEAWGNNSKQSKPQIQETTFAGVIHTTQQVKTGRTAIFRTKEQISYQGKIIPRNTLITGVVQIQNGRLMAKVESVRFGLEIVQIPIEIYGTDGLPGIPVNYDAAQQIVSSNTTREIIQQTGSALSGLGGTVGRAVGSVISSSGAQVKSDKDIEVKLIDNQSIILKISEK